LSIEFVTPAHHTAARQWLTTLSDQVITYTDAVQLCVMDAARCTRSDELRSRLRDRRFRLWQPQ